MKYFLTGATGFVGRHLTKALMTQGEEVTLLLHRHSYHDQAEESCNSIKSVNIDLLSSDELAVAMEGHDVVVHLAYGNHGTPEEQYQITVNGTKSVLKAAQKAGVQRFIYMSTISVYGEPPRDRSYTENSPRCASMGLYPSYKQEAELFILNTPPSGTEVVILQPGIIYGPGGGYWTQGLLEILNQPKMFPLFDGGQGLVNLIHVYDVVDAIIKASTTQGEGISGQCFIITNNEPLTWEKLFQAYESIVAQKTLVYIPSRLMKTVNIVTEYGRILTEYVVYRKILKFIVRLLQFPYILKPLHLFESDRIDFFVAKPTFSNFKATEMLGFEPKVSFEMGIQTIQEWYVMTKKSTAPS